MDIGSHAKELIADAEQSGTIPDAVHMFPDGEDFEQRCRFFAGGIISNFIITLLLSCAAIGFLLFYSVLFRDVVFSELDVTLPVFTIAVPTILGFGLLMLLVVGGSITAIHLLPRSLLRWFPWLGVVQMRVSPFGSVLRFSLLAVWCDRMGLFRRRGVGIENAVELAAHSIRHPVIERSAAVLVADMRAGNSLATAMEAVPFFPDALVWSVHAGEEIGTSDHVWEPAGRLCETEAHLRGRTALFIARMILMLALALAAFLTGLGLVLPLVPISNSLGG